MLTASTAREMSESAFDSVMTEIEKSIEAATRDGQFSTTFQLHPSLRDKIVQALEKNGFLCSESQMGKTLLVSWV